MEYYDEPPKQIGAATVVGLIVAAIYLLQRLKYSGFEGLSVTDYVSAALLAVVAWGTAVLVIRFVGRLVTSVYANEAKKTEKPDLQAVVSNSESAPTGPPLSPWLVEFNKRFNVERGRIGRMVVRLKPGQYDQFACVAQARWQGELDYVSERKLHDITIDRFSGAAGLIVDILFEAGMTRKSGQS